jgi:hypothetical protein
MIDDVSQTLRGQGITEADKSAKWYKDLKKSIDNMISTGTVSTSKKVKNPKTGVVRSTDCTDSRFLTGANCNYCREGYPQGNT